MTRVAAAVVQAAPVAFDLEATIAKVERLTSVAAGGGAAVVVFPEAFVSCYPRGITFGATVGARGFGATGSRRSMSPDRWLTGSGRSRLSKASTWSSASSSAAAARCTARRCSWAQTARCSASTAS